MSPSAVTYSNKSRVLPVRATLPLRQGEALLQVAWQSLMPGGATEAASFHSGCEGAGSAAAACAALLTSQRVLIVNERLAVVASAAIPSDMGLPVSCLWMGPALLVSTSTGQVGGAGLDWTACAVQTGSWNPALGLSGLLRCMVEALGAPQQRPPVLLHVLQVLQVCWDGKLVHLCSLLNGSAPALLGALADRLLIATRANAAGEQLGACLTGHVIGKQASKGICA